MGGLLVVLKNFGFVIKETTVLPRKKHKKQCNTSRHTAPLLETQIALLPHGQLLYNV